MRILKTELGRESWTLTAAVGTTLAALACVAVELACPQTIAGYVLPTVCGWSAGQWGWYVGRRKQSSVLSPVPIPLCDPARADNDTEG